MVHVRVGSEVQERLAVRISMNAPRIRIIATGWSSALISMGATGVGRVRQDISATASGRMVASISMSVWRLHRSVGWHCVLTLLARTSVVSNPPPNNPTPSSQFSLISAPYSLVQRPMRFSPSVQHQFESSNYRHRYLNPHKNIILKWCHYKKCRA